MTHATRRWAAERLTDVSAVADEVTRPFDGMVMSIGCDSLTGAVRVEYELDHNWIGDPHAVAQEIASALAASTFEVRVEVYQGVGRWDSAGTSEDSKLAA